jgi:hypothetical protein
LNILLGHGRYLQRKTGWPERLRGNSLRRDTRRS